MKSFALPPSSAFYGCPSASFRGPLIQAVHGSNGALIMRMALNARHSLVACQDTGVDQCDPSSCASQKSVCLRLLGVLKGGLRCPAQNGGEVFAQRLRASEVHVKRMLSTSSNVGGDST